MKKNKKGFTLVEVIVVLVILAILAVIMVPALTKWIDHSREKICVSNRGQIYRFYQAVQVDEYLRGTEVTVQKVLDGEFEACADDVAKLRCPAGGTYTYNATDNSIDCSKHGTYALPDSTGGGSDAPDTVPGTTVPLADSYWPTDIPNGTNATVQPGGVFEHNGSYYIVISTITLWGTPANQINPANFLTQGSVIKLTGTVIPTTTAGSLPSVKRGDVYTDADGNTFVAKQNGYANLPPGNSPGVWHKIG